MSDMNHYTNFPEFLDLLAKDKLIPGFTEKLIKTPNPESNHYYSMGDRWCTVEDLLKQSDKASSLLTQFSSKGADPKIAFGSGNLKACYIPDEDFINEGSAIVIFSLVGSNWIHTVRLKNQLSLWGKLGLIP